MTCDRRSAAFASQVELRIGGVNGPTSGRNRQCCGLLLHDGRFAASPETSARAARVLPS